MIAYDSNIEQEKEFTHDNKILKFLSCSLFNAKVKFPDNETEREVRWLNGSYVDLNASNTTLYFKVYYSTNFNISYQLHIPNIECNHMVIHNRNNPGKPTKYLIFTKYRFRI